MPFLGTFSTADPGSTLTYSFDFSAGLAAGETITSQVWSIAVKSGVDPSPSSRLIGSSSLSGNVGSHSIGNMLGGVVYTVTDTVKTSLGETIVSYADLPCGVVASDISTSGTYAFAPSNGECVLQAFRRIGVRRVDLTPEHLLDARNETNLMFADWSNKGPDLWAVDQLAISLIAGQATYAIDPATIMILDAWVDDGTSDRIIMPVSRSEYASYPVKAQQGQPTVFWFDRLLSPTVTMWPVPDQAYTLRVYRARQLQDANLPSGEMPEVPYRWLDAVVWGLADRLGFIYPNPQADKVTARAAAAYGAAAEQDTENVPMQISLGLSSYFRI